MASPGVTSKEIDLSERVQSFPGVYGAIVIPAKKGPVGEPVLVTTDTQLLDYFTPNGKVEVGYDLSYYSALSYLENSNKLWVVRAANSALYGGLSIRKKTSPYSNFSLTTGLSDPYAYVFDSGDDLPAVSEQTQVITVADVGGSLNNKYFYINTTTAAFYVWFNVDGNGVDPAIPNKTPIEVALISNSGAQVVASALASKLNTPPYNISFSASTSTNTVSITHLAKGAVEDAVDVNTGFSISVLVQGEDAVSIVDETMLIYSANQGDWANDVGIKLINYETDPDLVKEPDSFLIQVFLKSNQSTPKESWICSRKTSAKNGYGRNIYVGEVLKSSSYIRVFDNVAIPETEKPKDQTTILWLNGGSDGLAVTDSHMIAALNKLNNQDDTPITVIMDGGWSTPIYQAKIVELCEKRDCVGILSSRYQDEASSDYLNDVIDYRKQVLNINSSFGSLYTPSVLIFDRFNDRRIFISPDGFVAGVISRAATNYEIWFPPAGFTRGFIRVLDLRRHYTKGEQDLLYDNGINPIRFVPGRGIVVWGQKTLLSRPSALDRLNVRLLLVVIKPAIATVLENFVFEINDEITRSIVSNKITSYMAGIQARRGVTEFKVVCDGSNNTPEVIDANKLVVDLFIKPSRSAEFIDFRVVITSTGISLESAAELL